MLPKTEIQLPEQKLTDTTESQLVFQDELDLSRTEDLELFLESAEDVYTDAAQYKKIAQAEKYQSLSFDDVQGEEIFETLFSLLKDLQQQIVECQELISEDKQSITDAQVLRMQRLYDDMILLRDAVRNTYADGAVASVQNDGTVEDKNKEVIKSLVAEKTVAVVEETAEESEHRVMLCGVPAPVAGTQGIAAARTLREVLMMVRDRHDKLVVSPKKQMLVDKLVRLLSSLPSTGLSLAQAAEVETLAKSIDVPERMVAMENFRPVLSVPSLEATITETEEENERGLYNTFTRKVMEIAADDSEQTIKIAVAENTKARIVEQAAISAEQKSQPVPVVAQPVTESSRESDRAPLAAIERRDVINTVIPRQTHHVLAAKPELAEKSLTKQYLSNSMYQTFIAANYTSPGAFERMLDTTITQIESSTVDAFERWLKEECKSPFVVLAPLSVGDVLQISQSSDIRTNLLEEKIKYETFLAWVDLIPEMQLIVGDDRQMKFGELFARYMIESEMLYRAEEVAT